MVGGHVLGLQRVLTGRHVTEIDYLHEAVGHRDQLAVEHQVHVAGVGGEHRACSIDDPSPSQVQHDLELVGRRPPRRRADRGTTASRVDAGRGPAPTRAKRCPGRGGNSARGTTAAETASTAAAASRPGPGPCRQPRERRALDAGPADPAHPEGDEQRARPRATRRLPPRARACRAPHAFLRLDASAAIAATMPIAPSTMPTMPTVRALDAASSADAAAASAAATPSAGPRALGVDPRRRSRRSTACRPRGTWRRRRPRPPRRSTAPTSSPRRPPRRRSCR